MAERKVSELETKNLEISDIEKRIIGLSYWHLYGAGGMATNTGHCQVSWSEY